VVLLGRSKCMLKEKKRGKKEMMIPRNGNSV